MLTSTCMYPQKSEGANLKSPIKLLDKRQEWCHSSIMPSFKQKKKQPYTCKYKCVVMWFCRTFTSHK